ncbi:MAG: hypothetical protein GY749_39010 [Desulfobacteraceae bacterium]|nr:hypothetical protein [Desulfobacteraceae bacterium]
MAAVRDKNNINIPYFKSESMQMFLNRRGQPYMSVGGFGAVFRFKDKNETQYAFKVFTRDAPGRSERYQALHDTLQITRFPFMVDFQYVADGLKMGTKSYPVVVMEWGKGIQLNSAIEQDMEDDGILRGAPRFAGNLYSIVKVFQEWKMGHGDFQEGNLLAMDDNNLILIDYDGMFVPSLEGKQANEVGLADYQHPKRKNKHFGSSIDDFALISILYQLSVITPELWKKNHDDKRLILRNSDYQDPKKSELIKLGIKSDKPHVRALASLLVESCATDPLEIKAIEKIESATEITDWFELPPKSKPEIKYSSIIKDVISLTGTEVTEFESHDTGPVQPENPKDAQAVSHAQAVPKGKSRKKEEGRWGLINRLIFEETNESPNPKPPDKSMFKKAKKAFMGMIFEDET